MALMVWTPSRSGLAGRSAEQTRLDFRDVAFECQPAPRKVPDRRCCKFLEMSPDSVF